MSDAALPTTDTPWRRDPADVEAGLRAWATEKIAPDATVEAFSTPEGSGMSSETILFELHRPGAPVRRLVARLAPVDDAFPVFERYDLELQARLMTMVGELTEVPVPRIVAYEPDPAWLGSPFLVMERVAGAAPADVPPYVFTGFVCEMDDAGRQEMARNALGILARLHEIGPRTHDLSFLGEAREDVALIDHLVATQRAYYEWARGELRSPLIEATLEWLDEHRPQRAEPVLNWGDSRIGNVLWEGPAPVAVLDWEMAAIGPREVDLAWMVFMHRFFQEMAEGYGFPGLPDFLTTDQAVRVYEELSGQRVGDLRWYEVYAALRFAIISVRTSSRSAHYRGEGLAGDPDDLIMFRPLLERMLAGTYWA